ncbi:MAG TPA: hypothetical protein ENI27_01720 [bacterium]|nr:hypothetical protein [bacterium]
MNYTNHLYEILYPNPALVSSQYTPDQFSKHYSSGSTRYYEGKLIFTELDTNFRDPYFDIDKGLTGLIPHEDGRPKATKFISSYRVLEHTDFDALKSLYLANPDGTSMKLTEAVYDHSHRPGYLRIMAEITPLRMTILTNFNFSEFGKFITLPDNPKGAPKVLYTQLDLDIDVFLEDFKRNPLMEPPFQNLHPSKLRDAVLEVRSNKDKHTKGLSLDVAFNSKSFRQIRHGFMFSSQEKEKFFPMPSLEEIERSNYRFFKSMASVLS